MAVRSLKSLQLQMEAWITSRSGLKRLKKDISKHIQPSATLSPEKRVEIYQRMYWTRMREALKQDFPVLEACLRPDTFQDLCLQYIQRCPSESYTLNRFGAKLPEFIGSKLSDVPDKIAWQDLATCEWALKEVFHSPLSDQANILPFAKKENQNYMAMRLQAAPSLKTLSLDHKVSPFFKKFHASELNSYTAPEKAAEFLILFRVQNRSVFQSLDMPTWSFLQALLKGQTVDEAIEEVAPLLQRDEDCVNILSHMNTWLTQQALIPQK